MLTFNDITDHLLSKTNCSMRCNLGYIQDLHRFVEFDMNLIASNDYPKQSKQCIEIKNNLLYIVENYDSIKKNAANVKWK